MSILVALAACSQPYQQGKMLYESACANCHMTDGSGLAGVIPPLASSDFLVTNQDLLPCIVRHGLEGPITVNGQRYDQPMLAVEGINDVELANILNYVQSQWGDPEIFYSPDELRRLLDHCTPGPVHLDQ